MRTPIKDIVVKNRIRKDLGDIESLAESFRRYGQITPIVINRKNELIAGGRRLEAAKMLQWDYINAVVLDSSNKLEQLELEVEENKYRKDFSAEETVEAEKRLEKLRHPNIFIRIWNAITSFFKKVFRIKD
jgi:ParB family chromosome partitioning protein